MHRAAQAKSHEIDFFLVISSITDAYFDSFENSNQCDALITFPEITKKRLLIKALSGYHSVAPLGFKPYMVVDINLDMTQQSAELKGRRND